VRFRKRVPELSADTRRFRARVDRQRQPRDG
jgi:hypothetical protein